MEVRTERGALPSETEPTRVLRWRVEGPDDAEERPFVLVSHGFKGFMDWGFFPLLSRELAQRGLVCVSFNYSGSGIGEDPEVFSEHEAFAKNTYTKELEDLERMVDFARSIPRVDARRGALLGHSRGGGMAIVHAAEDGGYRALVTWAAIGRVDRFDDVTLERWREVGFHEIPNARTGQVHRLDLDVLDDVERNRGRLDIGASASRLSVPTLLVHGTKDETVPIEEARDVARAIPGALATLCEIDGAGHTFEASHPFSGPGPELTQALELTRTHLDRHLLKEA